MEERGRELFCSLLLLLLLLVSVVLVWRRESRLLCAERRGRLLGSERRGTNERGEVGAREGEEKAVGKGAKKGEGVREERRGSEEVGVSKGGVVVVVVSFS